MSLQSPTKPVRKILGPTGNRTRLNSDTKKPNPVEKPPAREVPKNGSVDSACSTASSSSSSFSGGSPKTAASSSSSSSSSSRRRRRRVSGVGKAAPVISGPIKRCDWITAYSDPLYISFHDKEWGVPVRDDGKLYELLVLSIALAEHTWVSILSKRRQLRTLFDNFDPASVAKFNEDKVILLCAGRNVFLSEPKLRAVVDNARQILKVQEEFGSFSNYCWRFMNNQPMRNGYRYARQVPVKAPKAELISKDLMRRGFRCVGPTVVYSFMQVSGMVNDHLISCFRYNECNANSKQDIKLRPVDKAETVTETAEITTISQADATPES